MIAIGLADLKKNTINLVQSPNMINEEWSRIDKRRKDFDCDQSISIKELNMRYLDALIYCTKLRMVLPYKEKPKVLLRSKKIFF